MLALASFAPPVAAAAPTATDFDLNPVPVNTVISVTAADLVSSFATDPDGPLGASSLDFDGATINSLPVGSPADAGFAYTPGAGTAGEFTINPAVPAFAGLTPGDSATVEISYTVTDPDLDSDTGVLRFSVAGDPGPYDELSFDHQGLPAGGVTAGAVAGVGDALVSIVMTGPGTVESALASYDFAAITPPPGTSPGSEIAIAIASDDSTADATAENGSVATATAESSSTATAQAQDVASATAFATADSVSNAEADNESTATAFAGEDSTASAVASDTSDTTASAINGSAADATATAVSSAAADAANEAVATATADAGSTAVAGADNLASATANAQDSSVAGANALNSSIADAVAADNSAASASASAGSDALASAQFGSAAEANTNATASASASAENGSVATADAFDGSTTTSQAEGNSISNAEANNGLVANSQASGGAFMAVLAPAPVAIPQIDDNAPSNAALRLPEELVTSVDTTTPLRFQVAGSGGAVDRVVLGGFPAGTLLSAGTEESPGVWAFSGPPPSGLNFSLPLGWTGTFSLDVRISVAGEQGVAEAPMLVRVVAPSAVPALSIYALALLALALLAGAALNMRARERA
tara:strand:+ start:20739 stop:22526 length:1788 start_codon:yes stop_codon:yes gene_type:complete